MKYSYLDSNVCAVAMNGSPGKQRSHNVALSVTRRIGISLIDGSLKNNRAGLVRKHQTGEGAMKMPSQLPSKSISHPTTELVNAFLENCRTRGLSTETLRWYSDFLLKFANEYQELPASPEPLEQFVYHFQSSDSRRHGAYRAVRSFYNWCERRYSIDNPMKATTAPRVRPTERPSLTTEQLKKLLGYPYQSNLTKALLFFLTDTGVRIGEAANLTSEDIFEDSVKVKGKTGERIIPISPMVREMLIELGEGNVFKYSNRVLSGKVIRAGRLAGVKVCPHDLRRSFATNWRGSDLSLKYIGGWASWRMVEHYSTRKLDKAQDDHKEHSPVAVICGNSTYKTATPAPQENMDTILRLAEDLGSAKEKIKQLSNSEREHKKAKATEEFKDFIANMPGLLGNYVVGMAKFGFHATMYNFATEFIAENLNALRDGQLWTNVIEGSLSLILDKGLYGGDVPAQLRDGESGAQFIKHMVEAMVVMAQGFAEEQRAKALIYRDLMGIDTKLEVFDFHDEEGD